VSYDALYVACVVGLMGAGLKFWRDSSAQEAEAKETRALADKTAKELSEHQADCMVKNILIARLDERVSGIQSSQAEIRKTIDRIDEKLDNLLEKS